MPLPRTACLGLVLLVAGGGCQGDASGPGPPDPESQTLTVRGSDTLVILAQQWAEGTMEANPSASVQVSGGGSGVGLTALIDGTTDIATASREIEASERARVQAQHGEWPVETAVALDTVALYVHQDNPIRSLSLEQTKRIFRGQVSDWSELGLDLGPLILYSRENSSGTYAFFKEEVLDDEDFAAEAQTLPGTAAVINAVSKDVGAIGYGGIGFATGVRIVAIERDDGTVVGPDARTASRGTYPLARPLFLYTVGEPEGLAAEYIDFALSPEGQALVENLGYFPLREAST